MADGTGGAQVPWHAGVVVGRDAAGRALRVSSHPEHGRVVLSLWQDDVCIGTLRLAPDDVPELVRTLTAAVLDAPPDLAATA